MLQANGTILRYISSEKPEEKDNWLLDLLLAGHEFKADRASLDIQDAGLTLELPANDGPRLSIVARRKLADWIESGHLELEALIQ